MKRSGFREVFIFVAGSTPQIITETIYALAINNPPVYPDEIYIITTTTGRNHIYEYLLKRGIIESLQREYSLPEIPMNEESFIVVRDRDGNPLQDIMDGEANEAMGNLITDFIRKKTEDMHSRLHCSLAGGRKTMSFYLGSALQLFGRPWDRLYHVLVTPEFESNPEFFYKPKKDRILRKDRRTLHTKDAEIHLAELPFIRLRDRLRVDGKGFRKLVKEGQREIDTATMQLPISVNLSERTIYIGDTLIEIVPLHLMLYTAYLRQKTEQCRHPRREYCLECIDCFATIVDFSTPHALEEMARDYEQIYSKPLKATELFTKHRNGLDQNLIRQNISKINKTIREAFSDETLHPYYMITCKKQYGSSRYGVRVERGKIRIE